MDVPVCTASDIVSPELHCGDSILLLCQETDSSLIDINQLVS